MTPHPEAPAPNAVERFHAVDALRALAMFLGVVLHAALGFMRQDNPFTPRMDPARSELFDLGVFYIHSFRMQLFFLVAGFFSALLLSRRSPADFARGRFVRIVLPLLFGAAIIVPLTNWPFLKAHDVPASPATLLLSPAHLWFLVYLCFFSALACAAAVIARRAPRLTLARVPSALGAWADSRFALLLLAIPTTLLTLPMHSWIIDTPWGWPPQWRIVLYYGLFFLVGWGVQRRGIAATMGRAWMMLLPLAVVVLFPGLLWAAATIPTIPDPQVPRDWPRFALAASIQSLFTWSMILGLFGLFVAASRRQRPWVRYLADSSYTVYLVHLPIIYWAQYWFADVAIPGMSRGALEAFIKFTIMLAGATLLSLAIYALLVRPTPLERFIGGGTRRA